MKLLVLRTQCSHWGVYLMAYLGTSSHISLLSLHLTSSGGVYLTAYLGTSSHIWSWSLHLTSCGGYIWALHLRTWPISAICFEWALIDNIDQWRTLLLALAVSYGGIYLTDFVWKFELISGLTLASQKSFLRKTNKLFNFIKMYIALIYSGKYISFIR